MLSLLKLLPSDVKEIHIASAVKVAGLVVPKLHGTAQLVPQNACLSTKSDLAILLDKCKEHHHFSADLPVDLPCALLL